MQGRQLAENLTAQVVPLGVPDNFKDIIIHNNNLWAALENNKLIYMNLDETNRFLREFSEIDNLLWFSVSPDGEFCFAVTQTLTYLIAASNLVPMKATVFTNSKVLAISWLEADEGKTMYAFVVQSDGTQQMLGYYTLVSTTGKRVLQLSVLLGGKLFSVSNGQIMGLHVFRYNHGVLGLIIMFKEVSDDPTKSKNDMLWMNCYKMMEDGFMEVKEDNRLGVTYVPEKPRWFSCDGDLMKFVADHSIFTIKLHPEQSDVSSNTMLKDQRFLQILPEYGICRCVQLNSLFMAYGRQLLMFFANENNHIHKVLVKNADMFAWDDKLGQMYAYRGRTLMKLSFQSNYDVSGGSSIMYWIYERLLNGGKIVTAANILSRIPINFQDMVTTARSHSSELEFLLFKQLLDRMKTIRYAKHDLLLTRQAAVFAHRALDLGIRVESVKEKSNPREFIQWVTPLIAQGVLTDEIVRNTIGLYGWEDALACLDDPVVVFDSLMENDMKDEALNALKKIKDPETFLYRCLRLYQSHQSAILEAVKERQARCGDMVTLFSSCVIPILESDDATPYITDFYTTKKTIQSKWASDMFCLRAADLASCSSLVKEFIADPANNSMAVEFMCRSLTSQQRYSDLAEGLKQRGEYVRAAGVAALGDPDSAFNYLPGNDVDIVVRRRCASRILNSLSRETAEKIVADRLLDSEYGIDIATLIEYLPDKIEVKELSQTVACYNADQKEICRTQEKMQNDALEGINVINKLSKERIDDMMNVKPYQPCSVCCKSLFTEQGIVYPCQHSVHDKCARELTKGMKISEDDLTKSCPICGILSVRMIDEPFGDFGDEVDPWSISKEDLEKLYL